MRCQSVELEFGSSRVEEKDIVGIDKPLSLPRARFAAMPHQFSTKVLLSEDIVE
jgi:hypothetical protein